ncbi:MAG: RsmB/NOP family class I SAM-dependent RNA methyltransferase [Hyphomicrobiales bacterium]
MRLPGRLSAAIEVLAEMASHHRPAAEALKDWGRAHRFAGAADRSVIATLVHDALRRKNSFAHHMGEDTPRALVLAATRFGLGVAPEEIAQLVGWEHGPGVLTAAEADALARPLATDVPAWIAGDFPEWLAPSFERAFGSGAAAEGAALAVRAPVDLRANTIKVTREKLVSTLSKFGAVEGPLSPWCVRIAAPQGAERAPHVEAEPSFGRGWFEVQDAASQVAALLSGAEPGMQVADICAGAGGKTLALAALMRNKGQIFAHDDDRHRLKPIIERLGRAGARNVQVIPADEPERLQALGERMDVVFVDAPCSGSGAWRRRPDAKWRFNERHLAQRLEDQKSVLDKAAGLVKPGGRIVYVTCSVLPEENGAQVEAFLKRATGFAVVPYTDVWRKAIGTAAPEGAGGLAGTLTLTPARHGTDGFFVAILERRA